MPAPNQVHIRQRTGTSFRGMKGVRHRKRIHGFPRRFQVHATVSAQLYLGLNEAANLKHTTVSGIVEAASWRYLSSLSLSGDVVQRLRQASSLITQVVVVANKLPLQEHKGSVDIHQRGGRQERRNELSEKTNSATSQVYELAQSEKLAEESQLRASMYAVLAHLATVNELILKDAAEEEILAEIDKLRQEQRNFEENTRQLEERSAGKV